MIGNNYTYSYHNISTYRHVLFAGAIGVFSCRPNCFVFSPQLLILGFLNLHVLRSLHFASLRSTAAVLKSPCIVCSLCPRSVLPSFAYSPLWAHFTSPHFTSPDFTSPHFTLPHFTSTPTLIHLYSYRPLYTYTYVLIHL
jgi:hypothetical protein